MDFGFHGTKRYGMMKMIRFATSWNGQNITAIREYQNSWRPRHYAMNSCGFHEQEEDEKWDSAGQDEVE